MFVDTVCSDLTQVSVRLKLQHEDVLPFAAAGPPSEGHRAQQLLLGTADVCGALHTQCRLRPAGELAACFCSSVKILVPEPQPFSVHSLVLLPEALLPMPCCSHQGCRIIHRCWRSFQRASGTDGCHAPPGCRAPSTRDRHSRCTPRPMTTGAGNGIAQRTAGAPYKFAVGLLLGAVFR
jgi:hypothetical protein